MSLQMSSLTSSLLDQRYQEEEEPSPHFLHSAVALLFCFPVGILALINSFEVEKALDNQDPLLAEQASLKVSHYLRISVFFGGLLMVIAATTAIVALNTR